MFLNHLTLRPNSDFMILDARMSISRNDYISNNINSWFYHLVIYTHTDASTVIN